MRTTIDRAAAWALLRQYNQEHFHLQHALTVEVPYHKDRFIIFLRF